ncbi:ABC transporter ATP-binding protein [Frigoribacterium sp. 2-23]|uniref:ABC transporter ATP-binding protein n=1 Tax=Frigoribacterium sp. 2-23 TaxID=3415006 RepID=UPI003C6F0414
MSDRTSTPLTSSTASTASRQVGTSGGAAPVARLEHVSKSFGLGAGRVDALRDVSLDLHAGRFTAVMGPSGSGKSTLMHITAGLDQATSGRVLLGDTDITGLDDTQLTLLRRRRIGFVFQAFNLVPTLDVSANIELPFRLDGRRATADERAWIDWLVGTLGLGARLTHRPHQLSGGQQQRVAIARALATRPDLVFADEPTGNLDSATGRGVLDVLRSATRDHGQSIAMVTHDPVAASYADRVVFLADGALVHEIGPSTPAEVSAVMLDLERAA